MILDRAAKFVASFLGGTRTRETVQLQRYLEHAKAGMPADVASAHEHSAHHHSEILSSKLCGCFYCGKTFSPEEITEWTDNGQTAFCPRCGIDSVLGSAAGFPLTNKFLDEMNLHWF